MLKTSALTQAHQAAQAQAAQAAQAAQVQAQVHAQQQAYSAATYSAVSGMRAYGAAAAAAAAQQPSAGLAAQYAVAAGWVKWDGYNRLRELHPPETATPICFSSKPHKYLDNLSDFLCLHPFILLPINEISITPEINYNLQLNKNVWKL